MAACWLVVAALLVPITALADREAGRGAGASARQSAASTISADDEAEAQGAFERAVADIARGRGAEGQRRLEWLIVRYPDSPQADAARAKVVEIYKAVAAAPPRSSLGIAPSVDRPATTGAWTVAVSPLSPLADMFRDEAGDRVFFAPGSAELGSRARSVVRRQADWLAARPGITMRIEGHADDPGSAADNLRLAEARAEAVRRALIADGVAAGRIRSESAGRDARLALCRDSVCSAQNRRAVSIIEPAAHGGGEQRGNVLVGRK